MFPSFAVVDGEDDNRLEGAAAVRRQRPSLLGTLTLYCQKAGSPLRSTNPIKSLANYEAYDRNYHRCYHRA